MRKYRIIHDYGSYEGMKFCNDVEYSNLSEAVKVATESGYGTKFIIVEVIDWEAIQKRPHSDYPKVKDYDCTVHEQSNTNT